MHCSSELVDGYNYYTNNADSFKKIIDATKNYLRELIISKYIIKLVKGKINITKQVF